MNTTGTDVEVNTRKLRDLGATYSDARRAAESARLNLYRAIQSAAGTMSELEITRVTGVQRQTVRKALGK